MGAGPKRPRQGERITKATWVTEAVRLAILGWSYRRIAAQVGKHHSTVAAALAEEYERVRPSEEDIATRRAIQGEQLQAQLEAWIPKSLKGDKDSALAVVRFMDRAAKLYGLDAPTRSEHTGKGGGPIATFDLSKLTDEQLDRLLAGDTSPLAGGDPDVAPDPGTGGETA